MTSGYESKTNLEGKSTPHEEQPAPASAEAAYNRLTGYGFARRYVNGKVVADIGREVGYGSRLLAETAKSVTALTSFPEASHRASAVYSAPNVSYRTVDLPDLPLPERYFDVVVALGVVENLECPEDLVRRAKRALREDGVLVISATDKQTNTNERKPGGHNGWREMYVSEVRKLLERHFGHVRLYRQGVVAGGLVFPATAEEVSGVPVEMARFSLSDPRFGGGSPPTRSIIAVCSDATEALGGEERPYLLLDSERRVFEEYEERVEDVELLRAEVQQIQETEVQAFMDAIKLRRSLVRELLRSPYSYRKVILQETRYRGNAIRGRMRAIRAKGPVGLARGAFRRSSALYRRLREGHGP